MQKYLEQYKNGILLTYAKAIGDTVSFINEISKKFSEASNWVWNKDTVDETIDETITEYQIVVESNKLIVKTSSYEDCLKEWAKKTDSFKLAFATIRSEVGNLSEFLNYLYQIKKNGFVYDSDKEKFLKCIIEQCGEFRNYCENQLTLLKKVCSFNLEDLNDEDVSEIASRYLGGVFTYENSDFQTKLDDGIRSYKANMAKYKLLALWKENPNTETPNDWSDKYLMPILCMLPVAEQNTARNVFDTINGQSNSKDKIDDAINYLSKFKYFNDLNDSVKRDSAFRKFVLKSYSTLIDDINDIKINIKSKNSTPPYFWLGSAEIEEYIKNVAFQKYNNGGSSKVNAVIDSMSSDDLKKYLKALVKENMIVGIEIINNNK